MKKLKLIFCTLYLFCNIITCSQETNAFFNKTSYTTIIDTSKKWVNIELMWGSVTHVEAIVFSGDTIIADVEYFNVFRSTDEAQEAYELIGFARETTDKKVFFRLCSADEEYLMYDFGANVSDTVYVAKLISSQNSVGISYDEEHPNPIVITAMIPFSLQNKTEGVYTYIMEQTFG